MTTDQFFTVFVVGCIAAILAIWALIIKAKKTGNVMMGIFLGILISIVFLFVYGVFRACADLNNGMSLYDLANKLDSSIDPITGLGYKLFMRNNDDVQRAISSFSSNF
ncbi:MAG: hypothetical protein WCU80_00145 [Paludibacteraceae bacterium]